MSHLRREDWWSWKDGVVWLFFGAILINGVAVEAVLKIIDESPIVIDGFVKRCGLGNTGREKNWKKDMGAVGVRV